MSLAISELQHQYKELSGILLDYPQVTEVKATNKRAIYKCPNEITAKQLSGMIAWAGWNTEIRQGLKSSAYYVQVEIRPSFL